MQLRKIELAGFKSFADRTELNFDGGITAIVGPNGCGKSNVVDAIRWVLGEQSAKSLRAVSMGDCIFAGTPGRKPLGFAEVTLNFDNSSGKLPLPFEEVAVTRRVYGSGEGEYFINREACRLRDIRELFMGTGVGTTAYSVIEQGEITRIISSDPKELRAVFDEAAGIGLYKTRLRAATAKLERVALNLLRVNDVLSEVEKNLRSVKYQAAKAARYREMTDRLTDLKLNRARRAFTDYSARMRSLRESLDSSRERSVGLESELAAIESAGDAANDRLRSVEFEINSLSADVSRLDAEESDLAHTIDICSERIANHRRDENRLAGTLQTRRRELEAFETRAVELERRTVRIQLRTDRLSRAAAASAALERGAADVERELSMSARSAEAEAVEALREGAKLNNRLSEIDAAERAATHHRQRLASRLAQLSHECETVETTRRELLAEKDRLADESGRLKKKIESLAAAAASTDDVKRRVEADLAFASERLAGARSRRELLDDLQRRRDGISDAARAVLDLDLPGTRGLVAELLTVPRDLASAVEAVLADDAGAVVVDSTATAVDAIARLTAMNAGRTKIISLERAASHTAAPRETLPHGFAPLAPSITCAPGCEILRDALFANTALVDTLDDAICANGSSGGLVIATRSGETVGPDGGITGGVAGQAGGLIWRKTEIERLAALESDIAGEIEILAARRDELDRDLARLAAARLELEETLSRVTSAVFQAESRIAAAETRRAEFAREKGIVDDEMESLQQEISKASSQRDEIKSQMDLSRDRGKTLEEKISALKTRIAREAEAREEMRIRVTSLKVRLASSLEKQSSIERQYADACAVLEEKASVLDSAVREIEEARRAAAHEQSVLNSARARMESVHREANSARVVLAARRRQENDLRDEVQRLAPRLKDARAAVDAVREKLSELSIEEREVSVRLSDVITRAREEFSATTDDLARPAAAVEDTAAVDEEIETLTRKVSSLGGVNMEALEQLDELQARHEFLATQRDDLAHAKESLEGIITKTRATSRKMFMESFEAVRENFSNMFRRLFGGGRADCELVDPDDVLESPIRIMAKPPGKEPSNLNLLSGGEKAMAAVALLFAMFATRPSPFLVLDEVDAPLDESNIGRFIDLMTEYLPICQFVVITHNRRTMSAADTLYGITMEEQGVSKKVSVSLRTQAAAPEPVEV